MRPQKPFAPGRQSMAGFSFTEIVVALAIIAVLGAILVPGLTPRLHSAQSATLSQELRALSNGIQSFRENVGHYPSNLTSLAAMGSGTTDICGATISSADSAKWRGPYISMTPIAGGIPAGDAIISLGLLRNPLTPTVPTAMDGTLRIRVLQVDEKTYNLVEMAFDGYSELSSRDQTGAVQWALSEGTGFGAAGTLDFYLPVRGC